MNKEVDIFCTKYKIVYCDLIDLNDGTTVYGLCDSNNKQISISIKRPNGTKENPREIKLTLIHELIHAILREGQYNAYSDDEPLVEWLAKCILSLKEQKII